jgi:DNA-directed RNA polymerase subunit F
MIRRIEPISMAEAREYISGKDDKEKEIIGFIKKFSKMDENTAKEIRKKLVALEIMKINPEHVSKIIDILPENKEDLNKIFIDVSLDEDETNKILEIIKGA